MPDYLAPLRSGFRAALAGRPPVERWIEVDGVELRLLFAGAEACAVTMAALAPLVTAPGAEPALTVEVWDQETSGVPLPAPPPHPSGERLPAHVRAVADRRAGTATFADLRAGRAVVWIESLSELPGWVRAHPLLELLHWSLRRPGRHLMHAGAVGVEGRGVLLVGRGGTGKSTLAVACVEAGMEYAGDDYVLVTVDPEPAAHLLYGSAKLHADSLAMLPALAGAITAAAVPGVDKAVLDIAAARPASLRRRLELEGVVMPRVTGGRDCVLRPARAPELLRALAPSTVLQLRGPTAMAEAAELLRRVPSYVLDVGRDLDAAPALVSDLIASSLVAG